MAPNMWETVSLRFWHGGKFVCNRDGFMVYAGCQSKTHQILVDELCYFEIMDLAKKAGPYDFVNGVYYQTHGMSMEEGLRKVADDNDVRAMGELAIKCRNVDLFVLHQDIGHIEVLRAQAKLTVGQPSKPKKLTPKKAPQKHLTLEKAPPKKLTPAKKTPYRSSPRDKDVIFLDSCNAQEIDIVVNQPPPQPYKQKAQKCTPKKTPQIQPLDAPSSSSAYPNNLSQNAANIPQTQESNTEVHVNTGINEFFLEGYEWVDPRPEEPIPYNQLFSDSEGGSSSDSLYKPGSDCSEGDGGRNEDVDGGGDEFLGEDEFVNEDDVELEDEGGDEIDADVENIEAELNVEESDTSDEEYHIARDRVKTCSNKLLEIVKQLQREAGEGKLPSQQAKLKQPITTVQATGKDGFESEYFDSDDDLDTPPGSEDEGHIGRRSKRSMLVSCDTDFRKFQWAVGQRFPSREEFRQAVAKYAILQGRNLGFVVSNKARRQQLGVKCIKGCPFYLFSSWHSKKGSYIVKTVNSEHKCERNMSRNKQLTTGWVAKEMLEVFKARPHWSAKEIRDTIKLAYRALMSRSFAYKAKYKAHKLLHGSMQEHYNKVGNYVAAIRGVSPHTVMELVVDGSKQTNPPIFQRLFNCFDGLRKGWKEGCRRIICVDAAFLKTFLGGQILSAIGRDPNDQMFPIAWAVVEGENNLSWEWFFTHLQSCLEFGDGTGIAIVSDEHPAILSAVQTVLPQAEHRHCARHVYANWQKRGFMGDEMKQAFWKVAKAYNQTDYNEALVELQEANLLAADAFRSYTPESFCRAFMNPTIKCDAITNNMAETFNGYIINARTHHLVYMMEEIRGALMKRVCLKKQEMQKSTGTICPRIQTQLNKEKEVAVYCDVIPSTEDIFNVNHNLDTLVVNLAEKSCTCRKWDMMGLPCCHAIACIYFLNKEAEPYVDDCYKREVYLRVYGHPIPALVGERHWPKVDTKICPPPIKIGPGRPRKNRIKDPYENPKKRGKLTRHGMEMTCKLCNQKGHNKRGCPDKDTAIPQQPQPKKPRGRPRKYATPTPTDEEQPSHHGITAHPTQLGRGGRMILGGLGARGRGTGRGSTRDRGSASVGGTSSAGGRGSATGVGGRGSTVAASGGRGSTSGSSIGGGVRGRGNARSRGRGRQQGPIGVGVLISPNGIPMTTVRAASGRPQQINVVTNTPVTNTQTQQSQSSTIVNNTPRM